MIHLDRGSTQCFVYTRKEGLLSLVAHDLKIEVTGFSIAIDPDGRQVTGRFDATSLRVVCAMNGEAEEHDTLTESQRREIEANIVRDVLAAEKFPEIVYLSTAVADTAEGYAVHGTLELHGERRDQKVTVQRRGSAYLATATIHQPAYGIRLYSALFGTLKVQADVEVRLMIPDGQR